MDDNIAALHWNRTIADGDNLMPKLPVHVRTHRARFNRSQRIRAMDRKTKDDRERLKKLNQVTYQSAQAGSRTAIDSGRHFRGGFSSIELPPQFALPNSVGLHSAPYTKVHTSVIGEVLQPSRKRKGRSDKGKSRAKQPMRQPPRCMNCVKNGGSNFSSCKGRYPRGRCEYFDNKNGI